MNGFGTKKYIYTLIRKMSCYRAQILHFLSWGNKADQYIKCAHFRVHVFHCKITCMVKVKTIFTLYVHVCIGTQLYMYMCIHLYSNNHFHCIHHHMYSSNFH